MIIKNHIYIFLANISNIFGRGKTYRKRLFNSERILNKNYPNGKEFCFLQVGANDGKSFDFLYDFVVQRISSGIVIEPITNYYVELCKNYKDYNKIIKVNKAVHKTAQVVSIYKVDDSKLHLYPDWTKGIASLNRTHLTKFEFINEEHIVEENVGATQLMNIIKEGEFSNFDYLQVDTEGYDYEIIEMFDFANYKPVLIKAEYVNLSQLQKKSMRNILTNNGYYVFNEGIDIVAVNLHKIKL